MDQLLMPSEAKRDAKASLQTPPNATDSQQGAETESLVEPPSLKLIVRLFLIPLLIVAAAVGVMYLVGLMAGGTPTTDEILARLKNPGGGRTVDVLVGPGSKQRYLDAKALVDTMKKPEGMSSDERIELTSNLIDIFKNHTGEDEGEVRHFLLLALGRAWQLPPDGTVDASPRATASRDEAVQTLLTQANSPQVDVRKAAIGAFGFIGRQPVAKQAIGALIEKLADPNENFDVRLVAATMLGPIASPDDAAAIAALNAAMHDTDARNSELVWASALSLAQLDQPNVTDTVLMLLDRSQLAELRYYDRETDPQNPTFRSLSDQEQQRFLINTMLGARRFSAPAVQDRLKALSTSDPSARVRAAATEVLQKPESPPKGASEAASKE